MAVEAAHGIAHHFRRQQADAHAVLGVQPVDQPAIEIAALQPAVLPQAFGRRLQLREMVGMGLEQVAHLVLRKAGALHQMQLLAVGHPLRQRLQVVARAAEATVERHHRLPQSRGHRRQFAEILVLDVGAVEQRIGEHLAQPRHQPAFLVLGEGLQVDAELVTQLQQQRHRDRALVVLDQVQIAGGDAQLLRHLGLGQAVVAAQAADLRTQHRLLFHGRHDRPSDGSLTLQDLRIYRIVKTAVYKRTFLQTRAYCNALKAGLTLDPRPRCKAQAAPKTERCS